VRALCFPGADFVRFAPPLADHEITVGPNQPDLPTTDRVHGRGGPESGIRVQLIALQLGF
jgi:hypothetical protein